MSYRQEIVGDTFYWRTCIIIFKCIKNKYKQKLGYFKVYVYYHSLSLHFNGHFPGEPGEPGLAGVYFHYAWIMEVVKDDGGGGDNWTTGAISRAKLQSNHHHQQTNIQFLYRPDAIPVAQPTVSKH